jgi:hypothetical protein
MLCWLVAIILIVVLCNFLKCCVTLMLDHGWACFIPTPVLFPWWGSYTVPKSVVAILYSILFYDFHHSISFCNS